MVQTRDENQKSKAEDDPESTSHVGGRLEEPLNFAVQGNTGAITGGAAGVHQQGQPAAGCCTVDLIVVSGIH